jgi:hypothetical protein
MIDEATLTRRLEWNDARAFEGSRVELFQDETPGAAPLALAVVSVTQRAAPRGASQFSIVFRGPREPLLSQRTYRLRHATLGEFAFFITPIAQAGDKTDYEACFSHAA